MALTFGKKYSEAPQPNTEGGSGKWIKGFKEGDTVIRFLQEIKDWVVYYEHYNPAGTAFPCTGDRQTCPGCTSSNDRMKQASRKHAVNALVGEYVDVYKLPVKLTNRLVIRSERNGGTITDRDYTITRIGKDQSTEYDLESRPKAPIDMSKYQLNDIETMLAEAFKQNFPNFDLDGPSEPPSQPQRPAARPAVEAYVSSSSAEDTGPGADPAWTEGDQPAPFEPASGEEVEVTEEQLRAMDKQALLGLCRTEQIQVPDMLAEMGTADEIVDYLLENV